MTIYNLQPVSRSHRGGGVIEEGGKAGVIEEIKEESWRRVMDFRVGERRVGGSRNMSVHINLLYGLAKLNGSCFFQESEKVLPTLTPAVDISYLLQDIVINESQILKAHPGERRWRKG